MQNGTIFENTNTEGTVCNCFIKIVQPAIFIFGTFGNILSFMVLVRTPMNKISTYIYLATLSVSDEGVLVFSLLRRVVERISQFQLKAQSFSLCFFTSLMGSYFWGYFSNWLIVMVTLERALAIALPFKVWTISRPQRCKKIILLMGILLIIQSGLTSFFDCYTCTDSNSQNNSYAYNMNHLAKGNLSCFKNIQIVQKHIDALIYSGFPFLIILFTNLFIIIGIYTAKKKRSVMNPLMFFNQTKGKLGTIHQICGEDCCLAHNPPPVKEASAHSVKHQFNCLKCRRKRKSESNRLITNTYSCSSLYDMRRLKVGSNAKQKGNTFSGRGSSRETRQLSILLLGVSFLFIVFTAPMTISSNFNHQDQDLLKCWKKHLYESIMYLNHSINFLLYCAMGNRFRRQLMRMLMSCRMRSNRDHHYIQRHDMRNPAQLVHQHRCQMLTPYIVNNGQPAGSSDSMPQIVGNHIVYVKPKTGNILKMTSLSSGSACDRQSNKYKNVIS